MSAGADHTVCLVDDDPSIRKALGRLLQLEGFGVEAFAEAASFLQHMETHEVPVLVLDIWMEGVNGMHLLARLCAQSPRTRVIFITGHDDAAARATVMQAGAFDFLIKPVEADLFIAVVRKALAESLALTGRAAAPAENLAPTEEP